MKEKSLYFNMRQWCDVCCS